MGIDIEGKEKRRTIIRWCSGRFWFAVVPGAQYTAVGRTCRRRTAAAVRDGSSFVATATGRKPSGTSVDLIQQAVVVPDLAIPHQSIGRTICGLDVGIVDAQLPCHFSNKFHSQASIHEFGLVRRVETTEVGNQSSNLRSGCRGEGKQVSLFTSSS